MMGRKILIIEDEPTIAEALSYALELEGFHIEWYQTGQDGVTRLKKERYDLVVLDIGLPDINGFDVCKKIRQFSQTPLLFLTARDSEVDKVVGLELGGDDYVTKPFSPREVTARIKAILRRQDDRGTTKESGAAFRVLEDQLKIYYCGQLLELSRYEYRILWHLIRHPNVVFTRSQIMASVWEDPDDSYDRTIDTHIKKLRAKLAQIQPDHQPIKTHRGTGYSIDDSI